MRTQIVIPDQQGRHGYYNTISVERKAIVYEHIESLPTRSSHYTRDKNPNRKYIDLPDKKSIEWFYYKYVDWRNMHHPHIQLVRKSYYKHIWDMCYNIDTKSPRVDKYEVCHCLEEEIKQLKAAGKDATELERRCISTFERCQKWENLELRKLDYHLHGSSENIHDPTDKSWKSLLYE